MLGTIEEEPAQLLTSQRVAQLNRGDKPFHVILSQQFSREGIEQLCRLSEMVRRINDDREGSQFLRGTLSHKRAMLYFIQPSTRTFLSFSAACQVLGIPYNEVRNPSTSSEVKGETEDDTVRVLSQYFDLIIMRHPVEGFAERMALMLNGMRRPLPIINGGSGKDQHPTQALLDIYTLYRCFSPRGAERGAATRGSERGAVPRASDRGIPPRFPENFFSGKTIAFVGDLKRGRTVRSLAYLLCRYPGVRMLFVAPPELMIGDDILEYVTRYGIEYEIRHDLRPVIGECNAVYMTRLQDEWDVAGESKSIDYGRYHITREMSGDFKPDLAILHPLPRRHEIDPSLDALPHAKYWEQVRNGMWMRASIIATIFGVDTAITDHYHSYYAH
ncbi:MAG: hypothetical protein IT449_15200 [Phycisphaerales bacterium]|nr:hypothetical protein [Phycisphaerales bacterium]